MRNDFSVEISNKSFDKGRKMTDKHVYFLQKQSYM